MSAVGPTDNHRIEERAGVYLVLSNDGTRWEIDESTIDGDPLYGYDGGCVIEACDGDTCPSCCNDARDAANALDLPTGRELVVLLAEKLGWTLTRPDTEDAPT